MPRSLLTAAVAAAMLASVACGGDAFSGGSGSEDGGGTMHDGSMPDTGNGGDDGSSIEASPVDAHGEPPPSCDGNFACVPAVPSGWEGPLEVYAGSSPPPACTTDFAQSVGAFDVLQAPAASCGCACGASPITCNPPTMAFYDSATCNATPVACATIMLTPNVCETVDERSHCTPATSLDITLVSGSSTMGNCPPQASRTVPPYSWGVQARGCASTIAPAQVDCSAGQICAPKPESGFDQKLCISHVGDVACPGGGYGLKHVFYTSVDDTRDCSACTCGPPSGGSCDFTVTGYSSSNLSCAGGAISYGAGTKCAGVQQPGDFRLTIASTNGSCGPNTSSPTGTATPTGPVTVCCPQ